jgi:DNA uptake protein ComE-like DNA-binding protein
VVERTLLGSAAVDEMSDRSEHSPNQGSRALPKNHVLNQTNSLTQDFQRSVDSVDSIGEQSADHGHRTRAAMASASMNQSLDNSHLNLSQRLTDNKMISLSKSKEYSKLANQIPTIFNIENGHKVLNNNDLRNAGINPVNTLHEKY